MSGNLWVPTSASTTRDLLRTEGSVVGMPGSTAYSQWVTLSPGTYKKYIMSGNTGANVLNLPLVRQGAMPVDLIRRAPQDEDTLNRNVYAQRFYTQASLRILLSDRIADYSTLPDITADTPVLLEGTPTGYGPVDATHPPIARVFGPNANVTVTSSTYAAPFA
ncbi:MAG: hypothetical protein FJW27_03530 [Acidimicrobiia bacterium]|nr:hypothetical protein [Acidimicrobiia bacterium]